jgi:hypothetical protein
MNKPLILPDERTSFTKFLAPVAAASEEVTGFERDHAITTSTATDEGFETSYVNTVHGRPEALASSGWKGEKTSSATVTGQC